MVINIDGLEWKRDKWGKAAKWFLKYSEKLAVKYADIVVADNAVIQNYVTSEYNVTSELIAYGADHVESVFLSDEIKIKYPFLNSRYAFKVCRIEPENNIHKILEAFSLHTNLNLIIIGNWDNSQYGKDLKNKYSEFENIFLRNPIYDQKILNQIRSNCYVYVHGHSAGGTNPSLVEAMYLRLPIICYDVRYNRETTNNSALFFKEPADLVLLLKSLNEDELKEVSNSMKDYAVKNYQWNSISKKYYDLLNSIS